jgi:hypothetical protein
MHCQVGDLQKMKDKTSLEPNREIWLFFNIIYISANLMNRKPRKQVILAILILLFWPSN